LIVFVEWVSLRFRTTFFVLNSILLLSSVLTGLKVMPGPEIVGVLLSFYALFILPGFVISNIFGYKDKLSFFSLLMYFTTGLICAVPFVLLVALDSVTFRLASLIYGLFIFILLAVYSMKNEKKSLGANTVNGWGSIKRERLILFSMMVLLFLLFFVFFYGSGELRVSSDALDHISFVRRALEVNSPFPVDSFYMSGDGAVFDPRKGLWHGVLAFWAYQADVTVDYLWVFLPSFLAFIAFVAFIFFALELTGSVVISIIASLFFLIFFRGEGLGWFTKMGFSRNMVQVLFWINIALLLRFYRLMDRRALVASAIVSLIGVSFHAVYVLFQSMVLLSFLVFFFITVSKEWRSRILISLPFQIAGSIFPLAIRLLKTKSPANIIHEHLQGSLILGNGLIIADPIEIVSSVGLIFFFALVLLIFYRMFPLKSERRKLVVTMYIVPSAFVLIPFLATPAERILGYLYLRIVYSTPMVCLTSIGIVGLFVCLFGRQGCDGELPIFKSAQRQDRFKTRLIQTGWKLFALFIIAIFTFYPLRFSLRKVKVDLVDILAKDGTIAGRYEHILEYLKEKVPSHSVIASDAISSYVISAFTDHFVTVVLDQHCSPVDKDALNRIYEIRKLLSPGYSVMESIGWLKGQRVDYVLLDISHSDLIDFMGTRLKECAWVVEEKFSSCPLFRSEYIGDGFHLFKVNWENIDELSGCDTVLIKPHKCAEDTKMIVIDKEEGPGLKVKMNLGRDISFMGILVLREFTIDKRNVFAGDTLVVSICWELKERFNIGMPLEVTLRFDKQYPKGSFYRAWYGKQYRRKLERTVGRFYRYTWRSRLMSGCIYPEDWDVGERMREKIIVPISPYMAEGEYSVRLDVHELPYVPNRRLRDYFLDKDSIYGVEVARIRILSRNGS